MFVKISSVPIEHHSTARYILFVYYRDDYLNKNTDFCFVICCQTVHENRFILL